MNARALSGGRALALILSTTAAHAQFGEITVKATHAGTGEPFQGLLVAMDSPDHVGRHPTDQAGIYRFGQPQPGTWDVEFHCPSKSRLGREIDTRRITVRAGQPSVINVVVPEGYCEEPAYSARSGWFSGYLSFGFEHSRFSPCDAETLNLSENTFAGTHWIWVRNLQAEPFPLAPNTLYYVKLRGTLKGPGNFGHMGMANYELDVNTIAAASEVEDENCLRDGKGETPWMRNGDG